MPERFVDTVHCHSHVHCRTCRERDGGRPWRVMTAQRFAVPGNLLDWDCPEGLPWDVEEMVVPEEIRTPTKKRPCDCDKARTTLSGGAPTRPSCLHCVEKHLGAAWVLITEHQNGYPHRLLAIGHLHEAEEESQAWPELHTAIREARKAYQRMGEMPDFAAMAAQIARLQPTSGA
ncbi:MAG TPA: hypothetical protein PLP01_15010 [Phycisphaerae bacterium]|nr:hypothetical protein [Phycisphaerae bacterium]